VSAPAIRLRGLAKTYGDKHAVNGLNLDVPEGSFFGLLGPNGAGKTTTIGAITGLIRPTGGSVEVFGVNCWEQPAKARELIGACPQEPNFDDFLGLERILAYHAGYFGYDYDAALDRARELLRAFDLYEYRNKRTSTLSGGMKRRLLLARALMHEPRLLILDEPTAGVDVELRRSLWEYVTKLNDDGMTVLLTTHYLEEAEALCDDVAVIDQGRVIEQGSPDDLRAKYGHRRVVIVPEHLPDAFDLGQFSKDARGRLVLEAPQPTGPMRDMLRRLDTAGVEVLDLEVGQSRLEDVFVELTRRGELKEAP
jgi:ABC-2 type transport system ATP-binding protein